MRAEEVRTLADHASDPGPRTILRRIAADYDRLAALAESSSAVEATLKSVVEASSPEIGNKGD
jgi:hypothetical protein